MQEVLAMDPTRAMRFASAMQAAMDHVPGYAIVAVSKGYDWASLGNAYIVNIGGSRGQVAIELAKNFANIKLLVQDAAMAIKGADKDVPEQLKERVQFIKYVLFDPQTVQANAYLFAWFSAIRATNTLSKS